MARRPYAQVLRPGPTLESLVDAAHRQIRSHVDQRLKQSKVKDETSDWVKVLVCWRHSKQNQPHRPLASQLGHLAAQ